MYGVLSEMSRRHPLSIPDCHHPAVCWSGALLWMWTWSSFWNGHYPPELLWGDQGTWRWSGCVYNVSESSTLNQPFLTVDYKSHIYKFYIHTAKKKNVKKKRKERKKIFFSNVGMQKKMYRANSFKIMLVSLSVIKYKIYY